MSAQWKLKNKKDIDNIFTNTKSRVSGVILMKSIDCEGTSQFLFAVSAKKIRTSVRRNYIKRLMRESVVKQKDNFKNKKIAFVYIGDGNTSLDEIDVCIKKLMK